MGTIGDQFADLAALLGGDGEAPSEAPPYAPEIQDGTSPPATSSGGTSHPPQGEEQAPTFQSVLIATICDLNGMSAGDVDLDADLAEDLDIQGLPLWALVAELERFAGVAFADSVVRAWKTPRDVLAAGSSS